MSADVTDLAARRRRDAVLEWIARQPVCPWCDARCVVIPSGGIRCDYCNRQTDGKRVDGWRVWRRAR